MAGDWREITLGDFVSLQRGHDLTEPQRRPGRVPVMGAAGQNGFHDTALAKGPGIVIGRSGASFGQVHFCATDYWPHNTGLYVTDFNGNDPRFVYYFLKALDFDRYNSGSAQPSLNRNFIYPIPVCVPKPEEQRAIAHILSTLDDKIESNRRMNGTLEAMARALFQSWFVDFDPVRAKAEGRTTGLPPHLADLFPDRFADSAMGEIPAGWDVSTIRELTGNIQYGLTQSASAEPIGPQFLRITDIQGGKVNWGTVPYCKVSPEEHERYRLKPQDILVARTGASTGENIYLPVAPDAVFASYLVRFQFAEAALARLVGCYMRTSAYFDYVAGCLGGSAQPNASAQVLANAELIVPPLEIRKRFADSLAPLDRRIATNSQEANTLAALSDTLLPKLISGEIRLKDADRYIGQKL